MNEPHDPNVTADHIASVPADSPRTTDHVRDLASTEGSHPPAEASAGDLPAVPGYRVLREIARGGMGRVLAAYDLILERDLALKVLLPGANHDRFVRESRITARLPHPGIPPIHALGTLADGSPFLAMKLIAGRTLDDEMKSADHPRLLQAFVQVCQAVGFAHSRGIIHRDLKPANVMVGAFGEVQVMDWGLAKDRTSREAPDAHRPSESSPAPGVGADPGATTDHHAAGESTDEQTQAGQVLGTPAYMAPEQARGEAADARSDVFALGGILCALLTGKPPFTGKSTLEVIQRAGAADLGEANARLDRCGADAELLALCRRCLSPRPADRPADGQAVADEMTAYLNGVQERLRRAELAEAEAKAKAKEEAKRRRLTLALAATVLLAVFGGGGVWLYFKNERDAQQAALARRQVELAQEVNEALSKATTLREQAKSAKVGRAALFAQAREQAQRATALVEGGPADEALAARVRQLMAEFDDEEKDRKLVAALEGAKLAQADPSVNTHFTGSENAIPKFRAAFRDFGMPPGEGDPAEVARRIKRRPADVRDAVLTALDEWVELSSPREDRLTVLLNQPHLKWLREQIKEARDQVVPVHEPHLKWLQALLQEAEPDDAWTREYRAARQQFDTRKSRAALEKMAADADMSQLPPQAVPRLARSLEELGAFESMVKLLGRAQKHHPDDYWINFDLGMALQNLSPPQHEESIRYLTAAIALRPEEIGAHVALSMALRALHRPAEAVEYLEDTLAHHPKVVMVLLQLALALNDMGKADEAIARAREAVAIDPNFTYSHSILGRCYRIKGLVDEALASGRKAVELDRLSGLGRLELGVTLLEKRQPDEAIPHLRMTILVSLSRPDHTASAYNYLGVAYRMKGQPDQAIAALEKAHAINPRNVNVYTNLGQALMAKGKLPEALASLQKAIELEPKNPDRYINLSVFLRGMNRRPEAIAAARKAVELAPDNSKPHYNLGLLLAGNSQLDEAIQCFTKAIAINPKDSRTHFVLGMARRKSASAHYNLGIKLSDMGKREEAIASYRKAIELDPKHAFAHDNLGLLLLKMYRPDEAIPVLQKAAALSPKEAQTHWMLGSTLLHVGRYDEAKEPLERALALYPKQHPARDEISGLLQVVVRYKKLEPRLPRLISGEERPATAQEVQDAAKLCRYRNLTYAAFRLRAAAFALDPKMADDLNAGHRYSAACAAALAGTGKGKDAARLDAKERTHLRKQALDWLRADLALHTRQWESGKSADRSAVQRALAHWQKDTDLVGIRDKAALEKLPPDEQKAFTQLWADVAALLKKVEANAK
jgi:tetratricopeptide (TPR) repeat protein/serine/threonine protein kinase